MRKKSRLKLVLASSDDNTNRRLQLIILLALMYLIFSLRVYAYLDPGTTGYILQLVIAAMLGTMYAAKQLRNKIKVFLGNLFSKAKKHEKTEE